MSLTYKIRLIDKDNEIDAFRGLFESVFNKKMTTKLWKWKYLENPMASNQPLIYIADYEGKMVGARPLLPTQMKIGNKILKVTQPCDAMVHPEHRRKGIFTKMDSFCVEEAKRRGYSLFYGFPNQFVYMNVRKKYQKAKSRGWEIISEKDFSYKIFSPEKVVSSQISRKIFRNIAEVVLRFLSSRKSKLPSITPARSYDIDEERMITEEFFELWKRFSSNLKINTVRNTEYLKWRFLKHPENDYWFFTARKNKELLGYFVTSIVKNQDLVEGRIVDYIIKDESREVFLSLLLEALEKFKKEGCDLVSTWAFTQPEFQRVLDRSGFIKTSSFPYNIFVNAGFFVVRKVASDCLPVNPLEEKSWYITQADSDSY